MQNKLKVFAAALTVSVAGLGFITTHEGTRTTAYLDPVGIPTVCVGHTGPEVKPGAKYSAQMCQELLRQDSAYAQAAVKRLVHAKVTQEQYDALVSFTFNVGAGNLSKSTLLRKVNAGDCLGAYNEFAKWKYAKGVELPGLVKRRAQEAEMWGSGC